MSDQAIESEIQAKGLTAPRITPADVEANIVGEQYGRFGDTLTICVLTLRNGFAVTGESACASPENFNEELGRKIARVCAVEKIWPLMGYALRDRLVVEPAAPTSWRDRVIAEKADLDAKRDALRAFLSKPAVMDLPKAQRDLLTCQISFMDGYSSILGQRLAEPA